MKNQERNEHIGTRRSALKTMGKTTVFVAPVIATFKLTELTARASSGAATMKAIPDNPYKTDSNW